MTVPKPFQLLIPRKSSSKTPDLDTDWRAIERWAKALIAYVDSFNPSGVYASLTGPGETTTPGQLTQEGPFAVNVGNPPSVGGSVNLQENSFVFSQLGTDGSSGTIVIEVASGGAIGIDGGTVNISGSTVGIGGSVLAITSVSMGFFSHTPASKQTVTGSRGGNAALASLLTALSDYGLITDSSSP